MAVGHPDYWRRMVSRISIEGYAPEYYYFQYTNDVLAGTNEVFWEYPIPADYLFNVIGIMISCEMPGTNRFSIGKLGGDFIWQVFDTNYLYTMPVGMFNTLQYGDTMRINIFNDLSVDAVFHVGLQALKEYEGT